jgi:hypothetical protein
MVIGVVTGKHMLILQPHWLFSRVRCWVALSLDVRRRLVFRRDGGLSESWTHHTYDEDCHRRRTLSAKAGVVQATIDAANAFSAKAGVAQANKWDSDSKRILPRPETEDLSDAWMPLSAFPSNAAPSANVEVHSAVAGEGCTVAKALVFVSPDQIPWS